jgi:hypothetical protein
MSLPSEQRYEDDGKLYKKRKEQPCGIPEITYLTQTHLQITGAYARIGINHANGIIYFLHRSSPEKAPQTSGALPQRGGKPRRTVQVAF